MAVIPRILADAPGWNSEQPVMKGRRRTEAGEAPRRSTPRRTNRAVGTPALGATIEHIVHM